MISVLGLHFCLNKSRDMIIFCLVYCTHLPLYLFKSDCCCQKLGNHCDILHHCKSSRIVREGIAYPLSFCYVFCQNAPDSAYPFSSWEHSCHYCITWSLLSRFLCFVTCCIYLNILPLNLSFQRVPCYFQHQKVLRSQLIFTKNETTCEES